MKANQGPGAQVLIKAEMLALVQVPCCGKACNPSHYAMIVEAASRNGDSGQRKGGLPVDCLQPQPAKSLQNGTTYFSIVFFVWLF